MSVFTILINYILKKFLVVMLCLDRVHLHKGEFVEVRMTQAKGKFEIWIWQVAVLIVDNIN